MSGDAVLLLVVGLLPVASGLATLAFFRLQGAAQRVTWPRLVAGNLLVMICIASIGLLGLEGYYRFVRDVTDGDARSRVSQRWFERYWSNNAMLIRDNVEYALVRRPGARRVTFFGDSFTAGHGVADVEDRFVNRLRRDRPDWEVHGMAVLGASTQTQLFALEKLLAAGYQLDVVVLAYVFNDLEPFVPELEPIYEEMKRPPPALLVPAVEHSYALNALFHQWRAMTTASGADEGDYFAIIERAYRGEAWEEERALLTRFVRRVQKGGGSFLAVTFPLMIHLGRGEREEHVMHEKLEALWRELGVPHLDLLELYTEHRGTRLVVSRFDDHPSPYAHGLAASAMLPFLDGELRRSPEGR